VLADSDGIPAPKVYYTLSVNSRRLMDHGIARATEVLEAAGAREIVTTPLIRYGGFHLMGTARMGTDPARSVVNGDGQKPRRAQPLRHRRQRHANLRRSEPYFHDPGRGAPDGGPFYQ